MRKCGLLITILIVLVCNVNCSGPCNKGQEIFRFMDYVNASKGKMVPALNGRSQVTPKTTVGVKTDKIPSVVLPVNYIGPDKIFLEIEVKNGFEYIGRDVDTFAFISYPDQHPDTGSEAITVIPFLERAFEVNHWIKLLLKRIARDATDVRVLEESYTSQARYDEGSALLVYTLQGRRKLMGIYIAGGPEDSVVVQDTILIKGEHEIPPAKAKLEKFFRTQVRILDKKYLRGFKFRY